MAPIANHGQLGSFTRGKKYVLVSREVLEGSGKVPSSRPVKATDPWLTPGGANPQNVFSAAGAARAIGPAEGLTDSDWYCGERDCS